MHVALLEAVLKGTPAGPHQDIGLGLGNCSAADKQQGCRQIDPTCTTLHVQSATDSALNAAQLTVTVTGI